MIEVMVINNVASFGGVEDFRSTARIKYDWSAV